MKIEPHELDVVLNAFLSYGEHHIPPKVCRRLTEGLDHQTKTVFLMRLWGWTEDRIAVELGLSQPYVSKIVTKKLSVVKRRILAGMKRIKGMANHAGRERAGLFNVRAGYDLADANPDNAVFEDNMSVQIEVRHKSLGQPEGKDSDGAIVPGFYRPNHERVSDDEDPVTWNNHQPSYDALDREARAYCEKLKLFGM
jgi:hypothetical protein